MAYRLANELDAAGEEGAPGSSGGAGNGETSATATTGSGEAKGTSSTVPATRKLDEEEERDAVFYRLEKLGYRVGLGLVER